MVYFYRVCLFLIFLILIGITTPSLAEDTGLLSLIHEALEKNPDIKAAKARLQAYKAKIPQAGSWDDPRIGVDFMNIPIDNPSLSRTPMTGIQYGIKQRLPFPGKKGTAKKKAKIEYQAKMDEWEELKARVIWQIREYYYQHYYVVSSLSILRRNQAIADELVRLAQTKLATNLVPEQDVLKAQIEYGKITDQILDLKKQQASLKARINKLIGRNAQKRIPVPNSLKIRNSKISRGDVLTYAKENFWMLLKRQKMIDVAKSNRTLAKLSYLPDLDLGFSYRQRKFSTGDPIRGEDFFSVSLSVPIPIFAATKQSKQVKEASAFLRESKSNYESLDNQIEFEIDDILAELDRTKRKTNLIANVLLPQSHAAFNTSKASYQTGKIDFLNVLTNQLSVLHFQMELVGTHTDYAQAKAKLEYLMGKEFFTGKN